MKPGRRLATMLIFGMALSAAVAGGYFLVSALETGKIKTVIIGAMVPLIIVMIALFQRISTQTAIALLLLAFWMPAGLYSMELYLFEIFIYGLSFLLILKYLLLAKGTPPEKEIDIPWFPFMLYIVGAFLTWAVSTKLGGEISIIRIQCIFPLALFLVVFASVRSSEDAERFLWTILTSAAVLGFLFLAGQHFTQYIALSSYAADSGRASMRLTIPFLGYLEMLPQRTSLVFAYLLVFAYSLWVFHQSWRHRAYAFILCVLFGCIIIATQGRGGAIAAALGTVIVSIYAAFSRRRFGLRGIWIKCAIVCLAIIGGLWYLSTHSSNQFYYQHGVSLFSRPLQDENLLGRFQRWSDSINLFKEHPLLGTGLRGYPTPWGLDTSEVLNIFLYTLLSFGLLGFIGFLLIYFKFLAAFVRGIQSGDCTSRMLCIAGICGMLGFFFGLQSLEPYSMAAIWTPLILAFAVSKLNDNRPLKSPRFIHILK